MAKHQNAALLYRIIGLSWLVLAVLTALLWVRLVFTFKAVVGGSWLNLLTKARAVITLGLYSMVAAALTMHPLADFALRPTDQLDAAKLSCDSDQAVSALGASFVFKQALGTFFPSLVFVFVMFRRPAFDQLQGRPLDQSSPVSNSSAAMSSHGTEHGSSTGGSRYTASQECSSSRASTGWVDCLIDELIPSENLLDGAAMQRTYDAVQLPESEIDRRRATLS
jgi:hypothetical protein